MSVIYFIIGAIIGGIVVRLIYNAHISIANEVISAGLAQRWVERNEVDVRF